MALVSESWALLQKARRNGHLPHAVAFTGGENAIEMAWNFAQSLVCDKGDGPCGQCGPCLRVSKRQSESVLVIESEKGMIKLEAAHAMADFLSLQRVTRVRIVLIADAQNLNPQATNAILKLVEEPPPETYLLFVTREMSQLLPTLRSRLQVVRLPQESEEDPENPWREPVNAFLSGCLRREYDCIKAFTEHVDSRENALVASLEMQRRLRDWCQGGSLNGPQLEPHLKVQLWRWAYQIEQDLHANVDRGLLMANFYERVADAMA